MSASTATDKMSSAANPRRECRCLIMRAVMVCATHRCDSINSSCSAALRIDSSLIKIPSKYSQQLQALPSSEPADMGIRSTSPRRQNRCVHTNGHWIEPRTHPVFHRFLQPDRGLLRVVPVNLQYDLVMDGQDRYGARALRPAFPEQAQ